MASEISTIIVSGTLAELKQQAAEMATLPVTFAYSVRPFAVQDLKELMQYVFTEEKHRSFTITLDLSEPLPERENTKQWYEMLCLTLGHLQYQKIENQPVLNIYHFTTGFQNLHDELLHRLHLQGFGQVTIRYLNSKAVPAASRHLLLLVENWQENAWDWFYPLYRKQVVYSTSALPVFISKSLPLVEILQCRDRADRKIEQEESDLFYLMREVRRCSGELARTRQSWKLTAEELKSKKDYVDFLLGKMRRDNDEDSGVTDIVRLKRFYQHEYEVLPLWYKQFGHVIKVLMGKRTLKSLWRDDVKKYR